MRRFLTLALSFLCLSMGLLFAQGSSPRLNDKDLERLMKNVSEDSKKFSQSFKKAVEKSSIRKTSREKEAKQLADRFVEQTKGMAGKFNNNKKADQTLPVVYQSLSQLDKIIRDLSLSGGVTADFEKVKSELNRVAEQFSYTPPAS